MTKLNENFVLKYTIFDSYQEGKREDSYDFVVVNL